MELLGITRFGAYALYLLASLYAFLAGYLVLGGWRSKDGPQRVRLLWFLVLPPVRFTTRWLCGRWIWTIFLWFPLGDDGPYEQYGKWMAAAVAFFLSAVVFVRLSLGLAKRRYRLICVVGTSILAALFAVMLAQAFTSRIYGWTARGAAESYLAKILVANHMAVAADGTRRIVEVDMPIWEQNPRPVKRFILYYGDSPIQEVRVAPHGWWWWTFAGSGPAYVTEEYWAIDHWETDREEATKQLNEIIRKYPNSEASQRASRTLEWLREEGSELRRWREELRRLHEQADRRRQSATASP